MQQPLIVFHKLLHGVHKEIVDYVSFKMNGGFVNTQDACDSFR